MRESGRLGLVFALWTLGCGDDDGTMVADAAAREPCTTDERCSDALFCNGAERCLPGDAGADARGCVGGTAVECLAGQSCSEEQDRCVTTDCTVGRDLDMDGVDAVECGGFDCDDSDRNRAPGNMEFCDSMAHDEDCDPMTFGVRDGDMDGFADAACCNMDGETRICGRDCDDTRATANPTTAESCNGLDDDCDSSIDEGVLTLYTIDADRDLHGSEAPGATTMLACSMPAGYAERADDCDDMNSGRNPSVGERCDMPLPPATMSIDDDCDGMINEGCMCDSGTARTCPLPGACAAGTETCVEGVWSDMCSITPVAETCNDIDDDCSGAVDEGLTVDCYRDDDDDGYSPSTAVAEAVCRDPGRPTRGFCPVSFTNRAPAFPNADCVDDDPTRHPFADEICDGIDNDCGTLSPTGLEPDEDLDGDRHTSTSYTLCAGGPFPRDDCLDTDPRVFALQPAYFNEPTCAAGQQRCDQCCPTPPCRLVCLAGGDVCAPPTEGGCTTVTSPSSYDFDCNGLEQREPAGTGCLAASACGHPGLTCGLGGAMYSGMPGCGSRIEEHLCDCDFKAELCFTTVMTRALACH